MGRGRGMAERRGPESTASGPPCLPRPAPRHPPRPAPARPPSPGPEAPSVLSAVVHGRGPPARPAAASHDARPVVAAALQVPGHGELMAPQLVVSPAEAAALLVQRAQLRDGGVICGDRTGHDRASCAFGGVGTPAMARAQARCLYEAPPEGPGPVCVCGGGAEPVVCAPARGVLSGHWPRLDAHSPMDGGGIPGPGLSVAVSLYLTVPVHMLSLLCNSEMRCDGSRHVKPEGGKGRDARTWALPTAGRSPRGAGSATPRCRGLWPVSSARHPQGRGCVHTPRLSVPPLLEAHPGTPTILPEGHQVHMQGPGRPLPFPKEHPGVCGHGNQEAAGRGGEKMGLAGLVACGPPLR